MFVLAFCTLFVYQFSFPDVSDSIGAVWVYTLNGFEGSILVYCHLSGISPVPSHFGQSSPNIFHHVDDPITIKPLQRSHVFIVLEKSDRHR